MATTAVGDVLEIDARAFARALGREPMTFRHSLAGEPLLDIGVIADLAEGWPAGWIEHHGADLPLVLPLGDPPQRLDVDAGTVVRDIAHNRCWAALWFTEMVPRYQHILDRCLDQVAPVVEEVDGAMGRRGGNIFVASPDAVAPAHFDRHHNLLLQVEGTKDVSIGVFDDPRVAHGQVEDHYGRGRNLDRLPEHETTFHLEPGDGLYIPPYAFHWVRGGPEPSVAFSSGFVSRSSERAQLVHTCNVRLRRLGLTPTPPGVSSVRDSTKVALVRGRYRVGAARKKVSALRSRRST